MCFFLDRSFVEKCKSWKTAEPELENWLQAQCKAYWGQLKLEVAQLCEGYLLVWDKNWSKPFTIMNIREGFCSFCSLHFLLSQYLHLLWDCGTVSWIYSIYGWAIKHLSAHSGYPRLSFLPCEIKGLLKGRKPGEANGTNGKGASVWPNSTGLTRLKMHDSITQELANEEWGRCYSLKQMATKWIGCCLSNLCNSTKTWQDIFFTGYESSEIKKATLGPPTFRVCTVWP